jgi:hypothetical protein
MTDIWIGQLLSICLFKGSKSEREYPVLVCDDGRKYRMRWIDASPSAVRDVVALHGGQRVTIAGTIDDIRGHWRLSARVEDVSPSQPDLALAVTRSEIEGED